MKWRLSKWALTQQELEGIDDEMEREILVGVLSQARDQLLSVAIRACLAVYLCLQIALLAQDTTRAGWKNVLAAAICGAVSMMSIVLALHAAANALSLRESVIKRYRRIQEGR
jgi:hypothetical protein